MVANPPGRPSQPQEARPMDLTHARLQGRIPWLARPSSIHLAYIGRFPAEIISLQGDQHKPQRHRDTCLLYTSPSPRDLSTSRMPSSA